MFETSLKKQIVSSLFLMYKLQILHFQKLFALGLLINLYFNILQPNYGFANKVS